MKSYNSVKMIVNGNTTAQLDIFRKYNTFSIFEHDANVFVGGWSETINFIENWKNKKAELVEALKTAGMTVNFEQTIK